MANHGLAPQQKQALSDEVGREVVKATFYADVLNAAEGDGWAAYQADCVPFTAQMPDRSVDFTLYSPPFSNLYIYSDSPRDMGNCADDAEFIESYSHLLGELYRVTRPGRLVAVHCKDLVDYKVRDGRAGLRDFPGDLIRAHERAGFKFHSRVTIWKCPVTEMQRTKAHGLLYKQLRADSSFSRVGLAEYLVLFRRWAETDDDPDVRPIAHTYEQFPLDTWQEWASPIWDSGATDFDLAQLEQLIEWSSPVWKDIQQTRVLNIRQARDDRDEKHICLAEGSLVLTREHGHIPIETVEVGNHALTHRGRWKPVTATRCNGMADTILVPAQGVANLVVTPEHKLYCRPAKGARAKEAAMKAAPVWLPANESLGSYVNLKLPPIEESSITKDEWWIIGRWLGDGHRGTHRTSGARGAGFGEFKVSCSHEEAPDLIARLGDNAGHVSKASGTATVITLAGLRHEVRFMLSRCGSGAASKRLPGEASSLCREKAESLLAGYLSADGCHVEKYDRTCATSISRALLLGMSMVAMRARGVVASVYAGRPERWGDICGRRVHMSQDWVLSFRNTDGYRKSGWIDEGGSWRKVRTMKLAGHRRVWDLQVEDDASYTAEGCIVHNCPLQLDVAERAIGLWSNPGETVYSPYMGVGSELYQALLMGRRGIGCELKERYWEHACRNLREAVIESQGRQQELFSE